MSPRCYPSIPIRLPFQWCEDGFRALDGSAMPKFREGAIGDILISSADILSDAEADRLAAPVRYPMLPAGTDLLVGIRPKVQDAAVFRPGTEYPTTWDGSVLRVALSEPLELEVRAGNMAALRACHCTFPDIEGLEANSLNHAFTLLSERYETHRVSHTGSAFKRVFWFDESWNGWRPLEILRNTILLRIAQEKRVSAPQQGSSA